MNKSWKFWSGWFAPQMESGWRKESSRNPTATRTKPGKRPERKPRRKPEKRCVGVCLWLCVCVCMCLFGWCMCACLCDCECSCFFCWMLPIEVCVMLMQRQFWMHEVDHIVHTCMYCDYCCICYYYYFVFSLMFVYILHPCMAIVNHVVLVVLISHYRCLVIRRRRRRRQVPSLKTLMPFSLLMLPWNRRRRRRKLRTLMLPARRFWPLSRWAERMQGRKAEFQNAELEIRLWVKGCCAPRPEVKGPGNGRVFSWRH